VLRFSLRSEEAEGECRVRNCRVLISDLKISLLSRICVMDFRFHYILVAIAVWRCGSIKRVVENISPISGYSRHCVKWFLYYLSLSSFISLKEEHDNLKTLNITRHIIYKNFVPSLTSQVF